MLGYRGISKAQKFGEIADRALAVDQLTNDEQPMTIGKRLQQVARAQKSVAWTMAGLARS